jgi:hypothetical protein
VWSLLSIAAFNRTAADRHGPDITIIHTGAAPERDGDSDHRTDHDTAGR